MSQQEEPQSPKAVAAEPTPGSPDLSDKETETFEDAPSPDSSSVRSLTRRSASQALGRRLTNDSTEHQTDENVKLTEKEEDTTHEIIPEPEEKLSPRISHVSTASLDNVNLDDDTVTLPKDDQKTADHHPPKSISLSSITNNLPAMPWSPPPTTDSPTKNGPLSPPPPPPARKISSAFSWLSRGNSSKEKEAPATSPPAVVSPRRNTASSVTTLTSNPEMMLSKLDEEKDGDVNGSRSSLKDRFKLLRMREEAGVVMPAEDDKSGSAIASLVRTGTMGLDGGLALPPPSPIPHSPNPALAPGTASGATAGPSEDHDAPVDWDLWQSVVYEGPAAVARTSPEELNKAIATGIPNAIRGVIWQVLAQSKNQDLELVYRELVAMGTDKESNRNSNGTSGSGTSHSNLSIHQEPASSASSVHSDKSGANGAPSPTEKDSEASLKAQAIAAAERKKRDKVDAAQLHKLEKTIRRDLGARTSYSKFAAAQGLQEGLFGVCKAYALFDKPVGYAQGMNFLVMPLLFNIPEEEAFCLLVRLMNHYHLRDAFVDGMPGLHLQLYQFERLLEDLEPALYCHLHRRGISSHLYATQWFLTLFSYRFPLQLVLRIYDLIFSEGLSAILRFGIVLMQKNADTLLAIKDMSQLCTFLRDRLFDVYIDAAPSSNSILENGFFGSSSSGIDKEIYRADQLIRDACEVKITPELLKSYTSEWEEKTRAERERELELETLRNANASYAVRVRKLEERIEAVDGEQAALATELVHTKVQNEELKDENESLKGQVRELKIVIEQQPAELEEAWKLERDDLMKRNERVHEENQKLEKEMSELEEELVQTKMKYAEINAAHETLQRRWADLKRQFD
ncbi:GTPase-activating protein GYP5 [Coniochaeta sp. 2T2.1]|nr:GTPase-activating protein GYP5 [Coniochaeta sp. 2T2.1]